MCVCMCLCMYVCMCVHTTLYLITLNLSTDTHATCVIGVPWYIHLLNLIHISYVLMFVSQVWLAKGSRAAVRGNALYSRRANSAAPPPVTAALGRQAGMREYRR